MVLQHPHEHAVQLTDLGVAGRRGEQLAHRGGERQKLQVVEKVLALLKEKLKFQNKSYKIRGY